MDRGSNQFGTTTPKETTESGHLVRSSLNYCGLQFRKIIMPTIFRVIRIDPYLVECFRTNPDLNFNHPPDWGESRIWDILAASTFHCVARIPIFSQVILGMDSVLKGLGLTNQEPHSNGHLGRLWLLNKTEAN